MKSEAVPLTHYRVDHRHSNSYAEWERMGSPLAPNRDEYDHLQAAGKLATLSNAPIDVAARDGTATLKFQLPREAVSLLVLDWK